MPYSIEKDNGKYFVIKKDTGKRLESNPKGGHDSWEKAKAQIGGIEHSENKKKAYVPEYYEQAVQAIPHIEGYAYRIKQILDSPEWQTNQNSVSEIDTDVDKILHYCKYYQQEKAAKCQKCGKKIANEIFNDPDILTIPEKKRQNLVNKRLNAAFTGKYPATLGGGFNIIRDILALYEFKLPDDEISIQPVDYEAHARYHEQVGPKTWIQISIYRMPSGNYEFTTYVS